MNDEFHSSPNKQETHDDHIQVCVRIRPMVKEERDNDEVAWSWDKNVITQEKTLQSALAARKSSVIGVTGRTTDDSAPISKSTYGFDFLFYPEHTNQQIFSSTIQQVVTSSMQGYHGSCFTYGQTSSGKTFTMTGNASNPGIIPLAIYHCFDLINEMTDREFLFRLSYMEIYNEQVKDLLNTEPATIKIQYDPKLGTILSGVKELVVLNPEQVISLLKAGEAQRHVGSTDMNEKSSRAHTLFKLIIESKERGGTGGSGAVRVSTLSLVDLAGSENAKMTNSTGERAREAKYINQSLLTLSTIIQRLSEEKPGSQRRQHLPYRDSKLTRLLQQSLDGNSRIAIVCTISPTLRCCEETQNTLKFAARAKIVKTNSRINEVMDDKTLLRAYREEIEQLKAKLFEMEMQTSRYSIRQRIDSDDIDEVPDQIGMEDFEEGEQEQEKILQMIAEMERMILKADIPQVSGNGKNGNTSGLPIPKSNIATPRVTTGIASVSSSSSLPKPPARRPSLIGSGLSTSKAAASSSSSSGTSNGRHNQTAASNDENSNEIMTTPLKSDNSNYSSSSRNINTGTNSICGSYNYGDKLSTPSSIKGARSGFGFSSSAANKNTSNQDPTSGDSNNSNYQSGNTTDNDSVEGGDKSSRSINEDVGDRVLFTVSKMLMSLKQQVVKNKTATPRRPSVHSPRMDKDSMSPTDQIEQLRLDLKLSQADSRFLQEELEKKDRMLAMLTEGLKEVELSQQQWLEENDNLTSQLEVTLAENASLKAELVRVGGIVGYSGSVAESLRTTDKVRSIRGGGVERVGSGSLSTPLSAASVDDWDRSQLMSQQIDNPHSSRTTADEDMGEQDEY